MNEPASRSAAQHEPPVPVYALAQISIRDRARYQTYVGRFRRVLERYAGQLLVADEAPKVVEGQWDRDKVILVRFNDERSCMAWAHSSDYQGIARDRIASTEGSVLIVHGMPRSADDRVHRDPARYDAIGAGYARFRVEDPRLRDRILASLGLLAAS